MPGNFSKKQFAVALVSGAFLLSAGLGGCGRTQTAEELLTEAQQYEKKGDQKAALIQLKNAVAQNPDNAEARLRLATLHGVMGNPVSAEKELRRAISLGASAKRTLPLLAQSLLSQGKFQPVLDEITEERAQGSAMLLVHRGNALLGLNRSEQARSAYQAALAIEANSGDALAGMSRVAILNNDIAEARALAKDATVRAPDSAAAWLLQAALLRSEKKNEEALSAYDKVLAIDPANRIPHIEKAYILIESKNFDGAKAELVAAKKQGPAQLNVVYAQALLEQTTGNHAAAKESLQKIFKVAPDHPPSILLAGAVELSLNNLRQSEQYLRRYVESNQDSVYARKLLAQALLKQNHATEAIAVLEPALANNSKDSQLLALAGTANLQAKEFTKATSYLEQARALEPDAAVIRTSLGMARLAQGEVGQGIEQLQQATRLAPGSLDAGFALIQAEVSRGQFDQALKIVADLEKAQPSSAAVQNIKGSILLRKGDTKGARASFDQALTIDGAYFPAITNLAQIDVAEKNFDAAKQRFDSLLKRDSKNIDAMNALAVLATVQGNTAEATTWLEKALTQNPNELNPALSLAANYIKIKQPEKAVTLLRKTLVAHPTSPQVLDLLGQAQLAAKDIQGALDTFTKLAASSPQSPMAQLRIAGAQMQAKNDSAAAEAFKRALAIDPSFLQARVGQMEIALRAGKPQQAIAIARQIQTDNPKAPTGYVLEGDILLSQKNLNGALAAYDKAFALTNSPAVLIKISQVLAQNGRAADGAMRLAKFHAAYPDNDMIAMLVAENHIANRQFKPAIASLQAALKTNPSNPAALNNLAWAYQQENDPRALATAEQAYKLAGKSAAVMDTLGWILVQQGDTKRGIELLRKAVATESTALDMRYHLAAALAKAGDKAAARKEAEQLLAIGKPFPAEADTKALLRQL